MPELKHGFGAAKMNKDLDERIVPNGEYRDALNIEVSTSEGSDVGTMQTILGNTAITETSIDCIEPGLFSPHSRCVGSIADEQNNHIYYFVADAANYTDYIMRYDSDADILIPIVVDKYQVEKNISVRTISGGTSDPKAYFAIEMDGLQTNINTSNIRLGMVIATQDFELEDSPPTQLDIKFDQYYTVVKMEKKPSWSGATPPEDTWLIHLDVIAPHYDTSTVANDAYDLYKYGINAYDLNPYHNSRQGVVKFAAERVLDFSVNAKAPGSTTYSDYFPPITGINFIDGMLIWTDGRTEPKKIIVEDFLMDRIKGKAGTDCSGKLHSFFNVYSTDQVGVTQPGFAPNNTNPSGLIVENSNSWKMRPDFLKQPHITVVKKPPLHPPTIEMSNTADGRFTSANTKANLISKTDPNVVLVDHDGSNLPIGSVVYGRCS